MVDKDVDEVTELATTTMEDMVEPPVFKCNAIIPLLYSNNSTTDTIASAVDMILIRKDKGHNCPWDLHKSNQNPSVTRANRHLFPDACWNQQWVLT